MVSYDIGDRLMTLDNDRKQLQTRLENLQYAMHILENRLTNNYNGYDKQINEIYKLLYCIVVGFVIIILYVNQ